MASSVPNPILNLIDNLELVLNQIKDGEFSRTEGASFDLESYWNKMDLLYQVISKEATKLCLAYSQEPLPSNDGCQQMVSSMEQAVLSLVSVFYSLPKSQGVKLRKRVRLSVVGVVEGIMGLLQKIVECGKTESPEMQKQATGNVWYCCDSIKDMPKDSKLLTLAVMKDTEGLIKDVIEELNEGLSSEGSCFDDEDSCNEDAWSDAERNLVTSCLGLVKVVKSSIKKVRGGIKVNGLAVTDACIEQYDDFIERTESVSPAVDHFVAGLYPPVNSSDVKVNAESVSIILESLLENFKSAHFYTEEDSSWITFLQNAVKHNMTKISQSLSLLTNS